MQRGKPIDGPTFLCFCTTNELKLSDLLLSAKTLRNTVIREIYVLIHEVSWESKQTMCSTLSVCDFSYSHTPPVNKDRLNVCTGTEPTFELHWRKLEASGCPHCADSLPYISQDTSANQLGQHQEGARSKRIHKWATCCTSIWSGRICFQSCLTSYIIASRIRFLCCIKKERKTFTELLTTHCGAVTVSASIITAND